MVKKLFFLVFLAIFFVGCGHTQSFNVGLMSFGNLEGKVLPDNVAGTKLVSGEACAHEQFLSEALRDALKETEYDTLVDAEVTSSTGFLIFSNCISVKGNAINSKKLTAAGGKE